MQDRQVWLRILRAAQCDPLTPSREGIHDDFAHAHAASTASNPFRDKIIVHIRRGGIDADIRRWERLGATGY